MWVRLGRECNQDKDSRLAGVSTTNTLKSIYDSDVAKRHALSRLTSAVSCFRTYPCENVYRSTNCAGLVVQRRCCVWNGGSG